MEATLLQKDAMVETYNDVQNLINKEVWQFHKRYGGDVEDWKAEANLAFVQIYDNKKYCSRKGSFPTWLYSCIWHRLLDYAASLYKQIPPIIIQTEDMILEEFLFVDKTEHNFSPLELLDGVQEDTKTLIYLIWNLPEEIRNIEIKNGSHPCHMKVVLRNYLFKLGWTGKRIRESFEEITRIINDN